MEVEVATYWLGWVRLAQLVAVFLVAVGVVAEFGGEWVSRPLEKIIDDARELQIAQLRNDAASARAAIAGANERAAKAEERAAQANLELEKLKTPRTLKPEQQLRLVNSLRPFAGQKYSFNVYPDPEPINLMRLINNVLMSAGWTRIPSQLGDIVIEDAGTAHDTGLQIGIKQEAADQLKSLAILLSRLLTSEELPTAPAYIAELKVVDAININVGRKPLGN